MYDHLPYSHYQTAYFVWTISKENIHIKWLELKG